MNADCLKIRKFSEKQYDRVIREFKGDADCIPIGWVLYRNIAWVIWEFKDIDGSSVFVPTCEVGEFPKKGNGCSLEQCLSYIPFRMDFYAVMGYKENKIKRLTKPERRCK